MSATTNYLLHLQRWTDGASEPDWQTIATTPTPQLSAEELPSLSLETAGVAPGTYRLQLTDEFGEVQVTSGITTVSSED